MWNGAITEGPAEVIPILIIAVLVAGGLIGCWILFLNHGGAGRPLIEHQIQQDKTLQK
jgi:membrane protein DedA with SNARE-associated domain